MILNIFNAFICHPYVLSGKVCVQIFCPILLVYLFSYYCVMGIRCIFCMRFSYQICDLKIFSSNRQLLFIFLSFLQRVEALNLNEVQFIFFSFMVYSFGMGFIKTFPNTVSQTCSLLFPSRNFTFLDLESRPMISFGFGYVARFESKEFSAFFFLFLRMDDQLLRSLCFLY